MDKTPRLLPARAVQERFGGVSLMWLWRRVQDGTLPKPVQLGRRNFWTAEQIDDVIQRLSAGNAPAAEVRSE